MARKGKRIPLAEKMFYRHPEKGVHIFGWYQEGGKADGDFRWRLTSRNHKIVGGSTEGYKKLDDCLDNAYLLLGCKWEPVNED